MFLLESTDHRADRFQIVRDCSIISIVNNWKNVRPSETGALYFYMLQSRKKDSARRE